MNRASTTKGLRLLVDEVRAEAAEWRRFCEEGSAEARMALFERHREMAKMVARSEFRRVKDMGLEATDCEQLAFEATLQSIERFDPDRGVPFPAFARPRIRGTIRNALGKATEARAVFNARKRAERDRLTSLKRRAGSRASADPLEVLRELIVGLALGFMLEDNAQAEAEQIPADSPSAYDEAAWNQASKALRAKLSELPDKERQILEYHYMQDLRFSEIAALLGLSRGRISQLHAQALARLRKSLGKFR